MSMKLFRIHNRHVDLNTIALTMTVERQKDMTMSKHTPPGPWNHVYETDRQTDRMKIMAKMLPTWTRGEMNKREINKI